MARAVTYVGAPGAEPISLYLQIPQGAKADLDVVARASIEFVRAVKEVAYHLDPSLDIRLEFASGTEGSLSLNSVLKSTKAAVTDAETLRTVAIIVLLWFGKEAASWTVHKVLDAMAAPSVSSGLSEPVKTKIAERVVTVLNGKVAEQELRKIYAELERDKVIEGVGITTIPGTRPAVIVPRSEFPARSGQDSPDVEVIGEITREKTTNAKVTIISPVLVPGSRRWRFSWKGREFGAPIKDEVFLERLLSGQVSVPLMGGIELDVDLTVIEEKKDGLWAPVDYSIEKVHRVNRPPRQANLPLPRPRPRKPKGRD